MTKTVEIPVEYKRLFDNDWREAAIYGGRYCFSGETLISTKNGFNRIDLVKVGDKVLTKEGVFDKIISVDRFDSNYDPKPMLQIEINGYKTNTTYDHKYFNGANYVPLYQLVWGIMATSQRRKLKLLCEQYGEDTNNELQRWLQNGTNETSNKSQRLSNDSSEWKNKINTQDNSEDVYTKSREQGHCKSQERSEDRQSSRKHGVGNEKRTVDALMENRIKKGSIDSGYEFQKDNRKTGERIITISIGSPDNANKNDGERISGDNWSELRWDTRFTEWQNVDTSTKGLPTQKTDSMGSKTCRVRVVKVSGSVDVWSISTEKHHNYFANGVNVSNSLKSHTVARYLLIKARQHKIRVACFREFQNSIAESSHQLLCDLIHEYDLKDFIITDNSIVNSINGSDFLFKGLHLNEQSIKSIEGIDIAWIEEAQTVSKKSIEVLTPTIRKDGSQIIYTYNRLLEDDPVHMRLVIEGRPNTLVINVNYDIALKYGMMPEVIRLEMEDDKLKRPALYKHKWLGEPNSMARKIYTDWAEIDEIPHEARLERYGLDFGYTNDPTAIIAVYKYNGGFILDEVTFLSGLKNNQIADILKNRPTALVIADGAEPKSIDEIASYGCMIMPCVKGQGSVSKGIDYVQQQQISVTRRSQNILKEFRNYMWKVDKEDRVINEPESGWDHSMDAIRYAINDLRPQEEQYYNLPTSIISDDVIGL